MLSASLSCKYSAVASFIDTPVVQSEEGPLTMFWCQNLPQGCAPAQLGGCLTCLNRSQLSLSAVSSTVPSANTMRMWSSVL